MSADAEKAYLKKEGVYDHIGKIIDCVIAERPQDACGLVEVLSRLVRKAAQPATPGEPEPDLTEALERHFRRAQLLDAVPKDEGGEPVQVCNIPDFCEEAELLAWAGLGFGELEAYRLACSLRNLAHKEAEAGLTKLRLWGKLLGTGADYYVAEAQRGEGAAPEGEEEEMEVPGTPGANLHAYYVTTDLCGDWQKLPEVRAREIVAARMIRRLLTGDPTAKVITHPSFDGNEAVLLRAQIARISADTVLCIKGYLAREPVEEGEEPGPVEVAEEFAAPPPAELAKPSGWTHMAHHLMRNGRTAHKEIPEDLEDDQKAKLEEEQKADPPADQIRGLEGDELAWTIKQTGDPTVYENPAQSMLVTAVRSLSWPGAVSVARGKQFANFYVGNGLAAREPDFFPPEPPDVQDEPEDPGEQPQPPGTEQTEEAPAEEGGA